MGFHPTPEDSIHDIFSFRKSYIKTFVCVLKHCVGHFLMACMVFFLFFSEAIVQGADCPPPAVAEERYIHEGFLCLKAFLWR